MHVFTYLIVCCCFPTFHVGMFKSLDEEARIPKGTSKTWFDKLKRGAKLSNVSFPNRRVGQVSLLIIYFYLFCCIERDTDDEIIVERS